MHTKKPTHNTLQHPFCFILLASAGVWLLRECKHRRSFTGLERKLSNPLKKSELLPRLTLCVCKKKKKQTFYFNSENQRGYLTDFPFVLLIVLMKPKKPKIFFLYFFSAVCTRLHTRLCSAREKTPVDFISPSSLLPFSSSSLAKL